MPTINPQFAKTAVANAAAPAIAKPMVGATVNTPAITTARVNFTLVALKDMLTALRASKADTLTRIMEVRSAILGAHMRFAMANAEAPSSPPGMWTPFGQLVLPIIHSPNPADRRVELAIVLAMCNGADIQLRNELTKTEQLIKQLNGAISELTP